MHFLSVLSPSGCVDWLALPHPAGHLRVFVYRCHVTSGYEGIMNDVHKVGCRAIPDQKRQPVRAGWGWQQGLAYLF